MKTSSRTLNGWVTGLWYRLKHWANRARGNSQAIVSPRSSLSYAHARQQRRAEVLAVLDDMIVRYDRLLETVARSQASAKRTGVPSGNSNGDGDNPTALHKTARQETDSI